MEVKIYRHDADGTVRIDSHQIPPYVGDVATQTDEDALRDTTDNESDKIAELVERLAVGERGVFLERYKRILSPEDAFIKKGVYVTNGTRGMCIVPAKEMPKVTRVSVDGEDVWPEAEPGDPGEELEHIMNSLREIVA